MSLISPSTVTAAALLPAVVATLLAVIARRARLTRGARRRDAWPLAIGVATGAVIGALVGVLIGWLISDVLVVFGFGLSASTKRWAALGTAELGVAIALIVLSRSSVTGIGGFAAPPRSLRIAHQMLAVVLAPLAVLSGAVGINADVEEYPTVAAAFGLIRVTHLDMRSIPRPAPDMNADTSAPPMETSFTPSTDQPVRGRVGYVEIPGAESGFRARDAIVYLPPAALVPDAPELPVLIAFAGQPGAPLDLIASARLDRILDEYAADHHGLAPIVVIPDQLGGQHKNPMCIDSPLGNSASYLTRDVPTWIRTNLRVSSSPSHWAVMGFSQGGTCAAQLGASRPDLFSGLVDISGELGPFAGRTTVDVAFGGDQDAYDAAFPASIMARNAPYPSSTAMFCVGDQDQKFRPVAEALDAAGRSAGMDSRLHVATGSAHDWRTVRSCAKEALPLLGQRLGMTP
ncbi:esterase [Clavibacter sp. VKM Ac-2872]|nr:alpha/beta hydrolase-fold protein [Clavibacter sp. VKM Ac-2872]MBF4625821.1 esterase [Clavibacter sp. VKM Ac-2872]